MKVDIYKMGSGVEERLKLQDIKRGKANASGIIKVNLVQIRGWTMVAIAWVGEATGR